MDINFWFQTLWSMVKGFYKRKYGSGLELVDYSTRMIKQIELAQSMGQIKFVILGDSNAENIANRSDMIQLGRDLGLGVNIGIGGMRADHWSSFFKTEEGRQVLFLLRAHKPVVIINVGGNNILQKKMELLDGSLAFISEVFAPQFFPRVFACLIPPIHTELIAPLFGTTQDELKAEIKKANDLIKKNFLRIIDTYTPYVDASGDPYFYVQGDAVHFSDKTNKVMRIPQIITSVKAGL